MKIILIAIAATSVAFAGAAVAADKKTGQDYAPGQNTDSNTTAKELAPGQRAKTGSKDAKDYAPGQRAHDANEKSGSGNNGSSSGTGSSQK
jgi:hypothetical protein